MNLHIHPSIRPSARQSLPPSPAPQRLTQTSQRLALSREDWL